MSKTVQPSKLTEWKGLDRISVIVHQMGNIWRETTKDDFGLDGEIEVVTPKAIGEGFETTGGIVKVQSKAGERYVRYDSDTSFSTPVDQNDLDYWRKCTFPVLFIVYHPTDDKLYFKEVKAYIRDTPGVFAKPRSSASAGRGSCGSCRNTSSPRTARSRATANWLALTPRR
jgi:Domain of unknown function (DUF4365)